MMKVVIVSLVIVVIIVWAVTSGGNVAKSIIGNKTISLHPVIFPLHGNDGVPEEPHEAPIEPHPIPEP